MCTWALNLGLHLYSRVLWPFKGIERGGLDNTISDELMSEREGSKEWRERWMDGWIDGWREGRREEGRSAPYL